VQRFVGCACVLFVSLSPSFIAAQDQYFDSKGVRLRYVDGGSGEPIVLLHGYANTVDLWNDTGILENLRQDHRVIAFDARGHGQSGKPHDPAAYGAEMHQDVVRLLDHLGIRQAHILGYSMGGNVVVQLLTTSPERFLSAVLVAASGRRQWTAREEENTLARARELESDTPFRAVVLGVWPRDQPPPTEEQLRERSAAVARNNDPLALAAFVRALRGQVVTDTQVAAIHVPTLGIVGSADPALAGMRELKTVLPSLEMIVVDGATHAYERSILRRPELASHVRHFVMEHPHPRASR
jgi:pimeloyl-ACP methyl ester carboxylesterase